VTIGKAVLWSWAITIAAYDLIMWLT